MKEKTPQVFSKVLSNDQKQQFTFLKAYKRHNLVYRITITGIFFALVLLFQYFEKFMPFINTYLKLNFSLIFILPIFYLAGPFLGLFVLILRFIFGPLLGTLGYDLAGIIAHLILFISTIITLFIYFLNTFLFKKINNLKYRYLITAITTIVITAFILAILNGLLFTPLFWWAFKYLPIISYNDAKLMYQQNEFIQIAHFGLKNYWAGILVVYIFGNMFNLSIIFLVNYPLEKIIKQLLILK